MNVDNLFCGSDYKYKSIYHRVTVVSAIFSCGFRLESKLNLAIVLRLQFYKLHSNSFKLKKLKTY